MAAFAQPDNAQADAEKAAAAIGRSIPVKSDHGRKFWIRGPVYGFRINGPTDDANSLERACVEGGTQLVGTSIPVVVRDKTYEEYMVRESLFDNVFGPKKTTKCKGLPDFQSATPGDRVVVLKGEIDAAVPVSVGPTWGLLVVPFKYQLTGTQRMEGGASAGAYFGYELGDALFGYTIAPIAFFGAANIDVTQLVDGVETKQSLFAISYGGGFVFNIADEFDIGMVVGFDHTNDESSYEYNDKPWIALQFGFKADSMFQE